jgi:hypothetical protein
MRRVSANQSADGNDALVQVIHLEATEEEPVESRCILVQPPQIRNSFCHPTTLSAEQKRHRAAR